MAITSIVAGQGLTGGGSNGAVTLAISSGGVLASNIAIGQVVKTFNGLTDNITLLAGVNVDITPVNNVVTVSVPITVTSTLPLTLSGPDVDSIISGSINITPTDDGGAVALQTGIPVFQTGFAALDNLFIPNIGAIGIGEDVPTAFIHIKNDATDTYDYIKIFNNADTNIFSIANTGITTIDSEVVTSKFIFGADKFVLDDSASDAIFTIPVSFYDTAVLYRNLMGATTDIPLIDLTAHSSAVPLFQSVADVSNAIVLQNIDENSVLNSSLDSNGKFFSRQVKADNFVIGTQEQIVGAVTLDFTGPSLFACDASGGDITYELPELVVGSPSGYQFIFKKIDVSTNTVFIAASSGQSIDGVTNQSIDTQWGILKLVSIVNGSSGYWLTI